MRRLASSVLVFEAIIVGLAVPVAVQVSGTDLLTAGIGAGALLTCTLVVTALLRYRWAYVAGSALQVLLVASGVVVPAMYFLGAVFAALWVAALWLGSRTYAPRSPGHEERQVHE